MEEICCLDREALGRLAFWREFRLATKAKQRVRILTHTKDINKLRVDLKLLLKRVSNTDPGIGALLGLSESQRHVSSKSLGMAMLGLMTLVFVLMIRNLYLFRIATNPEGTLEIEAKPRVF